MRVRTVLISLALTTSVVAAPLLMASTTANAAPPRIVTRVTHDPLSKAACAAYKQPAGCSITNVLTIKTKRLVHADGTRSFSGGAYVSSWEHNICVGMFGNCAYYGASAGGWHFTQGGKFAWTGFNAWQKHPPAGYPGIYGTHWCRKDSSVTYSANLQGCSEANDPAPGNDPTIARLRYEVCMGVSKVAVCDVRLARAWLYPSGNIARADN